MATRLRWTPGRRSGAGRSGSDIVEWIGRDARGEEIVRVVRRRSEAIPAGAVREIGKALVTVDGALVKLIGRRDGACEWLAHMGGRIVGRGEGVFAAIRDAERAVSMTLGRPPIADDDGPSPASGRG